ncbi:MAG TPA: hypothetical protein VH540_00115 [Ktedonobacterales bacterium]
MHPAGFFAGPAQAGKGTAPAGGADQQRLGIGPQRAVLLQRGVVVGGQWRGQLGIQGSAILRVGGLESGGRPAGPSGGVARDYRLTVDKATSSTSTICWRGVP